MERPTNYEKLPDGKKCRCLHLWRDVDGSLWCCKREDGATTEPVDGAIFFDASASPQVCGITKEDQQRLALQEMITQIAGDDADAVREQPMPFALVVCEVAFAMGITEGLSRARDQIDAAFSKK